MSAWDAGGIHVGSPRGAFVRSEVCDKIKIVRGGPTHQKFSWISSSAAASQMVGPITSSSAISVDISCVSRGARGWVVSPIFVHGFDKRFLLDLTSQLRDSRGNLGLHAQGNEQTRFVEPTSRTRDERRYAPQGQAEGDAEAS